jgi:MFS family permease
MRRALFSLHDISRPIVAFFRNRHVNLLNLHYGLHAIAMTGGGAFYSVFLLKSGTPAPIVLLAVALIFVGRFLARPLILPIAVRAGVRGLLIAGTLFSALQYPLLAEVEGPGPGLFALVAMSAIGDTIYWTAYHAYFAAMGDDEHRGHQIGLREAIAAIVGVASPLIAGWLLVAYGPRVAFGVTAAIVAISAVPLFFTPDVRVPPTAPGAFRAARFGALVFAADGLSAGGFHITWQIALFLALRESYVAYGGALAIAAFVAAVAGLALGRWIDAGHGARLMWGAYAVWASVILLRALSVGHAPLAVIANALGALSGCVVTPTQMTPVYTEAKRAPCVLRFHLMCEAGWDIGGAASLSAAALLIWLGAPLSAVVATGLAGLVLLAELLRRYHARRLPLGMSATV